MPKQLIQPNPIIGWRGLNERRLVNGAVTETTSLNNVRVRDGVILGRKGLNELADDVTSAIGTTPIIGQWEFARSTSLTAKLLRMTRTRVEAFNGTTWDNVTGTDLTGLATTRPQACMHAESDFLVFTNEGKDRPRKYTGTGNTAVLGGTPPYAKAIASYVGFLCLGNCSDDASTFNGIKLVLSDDPDGTWTDCSTQDRFVTTMFLDESPGPILAMGVLGRSLYVYKSDAIIIVTFTGGVTRFNRTKMPFPMGIIAPLSLQTCGELGHIFVAQDRNLYINNGAKVEQLPNAVQKSLRETLAIDDAPQIRSAVNPDTDTYELFWNPTASTYNSGRISYNYREGTFTKATYPIEFNAACSFRDDGDSAALLTASTATLTYELDTGTNDNGTAVTRFFDIDWTNFDVQGNKYLCGGEFTFRKAKDCRVKISVAVDRSSKFQYPKTFDLRGNDPDEEMVRLSYNIPSPVFGTWFKFRLNFYHDGATNVCEFREFTPEFARVSETQKDTPSLGAVNKV